MIKFILQYLFHSRKQVKQKIINREVSSKFTDTTEQIIQKNSVMKTNKIVQKEKNILNIN